MKKILVLTLSGLLAACATKQLPPEISYDADFKDRMVTLSGEAYFEVQHLTTDAAFTVIFTKHGGWFTFKTRVKVFQ